MALHTHNVQCSSVNSNCVCKVIDNTVHRALGPEVCRVNIINVPREGVSADSQQPRQHHLPFGNALPGPQCLVNNGKDSNNDSYSCIISSAFSVGRQPERISALNLQASIAVPPGQVYMRCASSCWSASRAPVLGLIRVDVAFGLRRRVMDGCPSDGDKHSSQRRAVRVLSMYSLTKPSPSSPPGNKIEDMGLKPLADHRLV